MAKITRIGIDLAKSVFQVHAVDEQERVVERRSFRREALLRWLAKLEPCSIGFEACSSAHWWGRRVEEMGHRAVLLPPAYVKPYVKRSKNDAADAEAICEAMSRPSMRQVPLKTADQQAVLALHRYRDGLIGSRTQAVNRLRGLLAEFGLTAARGRAGVAALLERARRAEDALPDRLRLVVELLAEELAGLEQRLKRLEAEIARHARGSREALLLQTIPNVGPITASAAIATIGDIQRFSSARHLAAWLGLTPRQESTGGKTRLRAISKMGDPYLRRLLVIGATGRLALAPHGKTPASGWINKLLASKEPRLVSIAIANKTARIIWAVLASGKPFDPNHRQLAA